MRALFCVLASAPVSALAANTARYAHSATLLTTGHVLVCGGITAGGVPVNSCEIIQTARDGSVIDAGAMNVTRASHTATVLPDGRVLVTGGVNNAGTVVATAELYDPSANSWSNVATNMQHARMAHTATLLNDGRVLICGGMRDTGTTINNSCDIFCTATSQTGCGGGAFAFVNAPANLQFGRAMHTATLLKDGKVWFAGGWNPASTPNYLATTERFDPSNGIMNSAAPLSQGRAFHTSTLMGHGKVLVAGGFNGDDSTVNGASRGLLRTAEIYDPVGNSVIPAASMQERREMHSAVLTAEDTVLLEGGLGNVPTTYITTDVRATLEPGSGVSHTFGAGVAIPTTTVTGGSMVLKADFYLGTAIAGVIEDGEIWYSTPHAHVSGVSYTYFTPAAETAGGTGLRTSLNGVEVGCDLLGVCGYIQEDLTFQGYGGKTVFLPKDASDVSVVPPVPTAGSLTFDATVGSDAAATANVTNGNVTATVTFELPLQTVGATISSATLQILPPSYSATLVKTSSFTANIATGWGTFSGQTVALNALQTAGQVTVNLTLTNLTGTLTASGEAVSVTSPQTLTVGTQMTNLSGLLRYTASDVNVGGSDFFVDVATVVIRRMVLSSPAYYDPKVNSWSHIRPGRASEVTDAGVRGRFGGTTTLLVNNDALTVGGRECNDGSATCASFAPKVTGVNRQDYVEYSAFKNWSAANAPMASERVFHTATNLPDGKILVVGGSNGPNVLRSAEIYDPVTETAVATPAPMHDVRDLHTATLLPNGRVLIAGGFTTNATSTGSTATSEIYYPDTGVFLRSGSMANARSNHSAALLRDGNPIVSGGFGPNDVITATCEIFYSTAMAWRSAPDMPSARALHTLTVLKDGRIMVAGGINSNGVLNTVSAWNPATGAWAALAAMPSALYSHTATLLSDGRVLVAGGNNGLGEVDASYIYDPSANTWSTTPIPAGRQGILYQPRFGHNAVALPNGEVVISGGSQRFGTLTEQIEFYHPTDSVWVSSGITFGSAVGSILPRSYHTMTLATNNKLYAIGGTDGVVGGQGTAFYKTVERAYFTSDPDSHMPNPTVPFASPRQSSILSTSTSPFLPNTLFTVTGSQFRGGTEASGGGGASANSSFAFPHLVLSQVDGSGGPGSQSNSGFLIDLTTQIYANPGNLNTLNSSVTVLVPATNSAMPYGWYHARIGSNDIYSNPTAIQVGPAKPIAAPTNVVGVAQGTSSMTWTWTAVAGVDGYNVYQTTTGVLISTSATTSYVQQGLAPNTTASIRVAGYTLTGDGPIAQGATNFTMAAAPTGVYITSVTFSDLLLVWATGGNETGTIYEVSQSTDNFVNSYSTPVPKILGLTQNQTVINNLQSATTYYFRVQAFNGALLPGNFSATVSTLTRTSLSAIGGTPISSTQIDWSWTNPGGVINFNVYNATTGVLLASPGGGAVGYSDTGLPVNSARSILVSVVTNAGEGPLTPSPTYFTLANAPLAGSPDFSLISNGSFTVNWTGNGNPPYTNYRAAIIDPLISTTPVQDVVVTGPAVAKTFLGLTPGTLYVSSVAAVNGNFVESSWLVSSTYTLAQPARNLTVLNTTPVSILVSWDTQQNGPNVQWELTYSTTAFAAGTAVSTAIPFSSAFTGNVSTITGLLTGTTYWIRVQGRTPLGAVTTFEPPLATLSTVTFNGGAAIGSLAGLIDADQNSAIAGSIAGPRSVEVRVPANSFPSDLTMTISSFNVAGTLCPGGVNVALSITNSPALQPIKPVFLTLSYNPGELGTIPLNRVVVFRYEPVSGTCVPLETTADGSSIRTQINHFSVFQVGQVTLATDPGAARIFPNPFRSSSDSYLTIDNVPASSRVRIFTLRGELVADVLANSSGIATWRGTNGSGRSVASGLYLVVVESGSSKKIMKLSVLR